ncbi:MAG: sulfatase-like hydrolase/transferase [Rikenellaceae bacterium]
MRLKTLLLLTTASTTAVFAKQPNIILIVADDLGSGDIGCYGSTYINTPNIDRMAAEGVLLTDFHTNGSVSSPTRAALMTGRYQQRCGIDMVVSAANHRHVGLAAEEYTLAEALKDQGYTTAIYGKWHLGYQEQFNPIHQGFDYFEGYVAGNVDYHSHLDLVNIHDWWSGTTEFREEGYTTDLISDKSVKFIETHQDETFFLYVPHEAPHNPLQGRNSPVQRYEEGVERDTSVKETKSNKDLYKEMIEVMDEGVGRILEALERCDLVDDTIVIFTSDNGATAQGSNAPYRGKKSTFFEGGHRVPAIIWSPNKKISPQVPYVYDSPVMMMDLYPSFVKLAGGKIPKNLDSIDALSYIRKGKKTPSRDLFWANSSDWSAMRSGDWKMVINKDNSYLFNLEDDIAESENLLDKYPERGAEMTLAIKNWLTSVTPKPANE